MSIIKHRRRIPSVDQFSIAVEWLRCNEGDLGEAQACKTVADWLEVEADEVFLRRMSKNTRIPIGKLRLKLEEMKHVVET